MKAVILAGGSGSRLREVIRDVPKPMAPVGGKPFLEYLIMQLVKWDVRDIVLSVGYKADLIESYFRDGNRWGAKIEYSRETSPLGTGGAFKKALQTTDAENVLAMNGDSFTDLDLDGFTRFHLAHSGIVSMALVPLTDTSRFGKVILSESGRISSFREKEDTGPGLVNSGYYLVRREILSFMPDEAFSLERGIFPSLLPTLMQGKVFPSFFIDIGTPEDYALLCDNEALIGHLRQGGRAGDLKMRKP